MVGGGNADRILYLAHTDVEAICTDIDVVDLMHKVFCAHGSGHSALPEEAYLSWRNDNMDIVRSLNMPGYLGGRLFGAVGTKIINSNPANLGRGIRRANGLTLLFDPQTGRVRCIMEASSISAVRTAAVSMLALHLLVGQGFRALSVLGTGVIGLTHLQLAIRLFPSIERIFLFDIDAVRAIAARDAVRRQAGRRVGIDVTSCAEDAVRGSDAVVAATTVTTAYIPHAWLKPGCVLLNVSLDDFLPEVFLRADLLFVDDWNLVAADNRRLLGKLYREGKVVGPGCTSGLSGARAVDAELGDLTLGRHPGRGSAEEIILVNPFGLAIEDIGVASRVFDIAQQRGFGVYLNV